MFKIKGKPSDKVLVFDLDDTLVRTEAKIKILDRKTKEVIRELTPQEFNQFEKKKGHVLNFDDFDCPILLRQGRIVHEMFELLKRNYNKHVPIAILTARASSELVRDFFLQNGIDIHPELVIAVNDPQFEFEGTIPERKSKAIKKLIDLGFKDLTFFDDHDENLRLAKETEGYRSAKIHTIKVD
jgi:FMN phosphatase YigB (HAD superfamily)